MIEDPEIPDPVDAALAELAGMDLPLVRHVHAQALATTDPEQINGLGRTYQRIARSLRQTLALQAKLAREAMPLFEQAMRDRDAFYNNEPFWSTLHEIDLDAYMVEAGFERDKLIHDGVTAVVDRDIFPDVADDETEDCGRKAAWHVIGARK